MLGLLVLLVACSPKPITFKQGYDRIITLDEKYNASFREEIIMDGGTVAPLENINAYINDLESMQSTYKKMPKTNDTLALINLTIGRTYMLESERYFQLFANIGSDGLVKYNFTCSQIGPLSQATNYMEKSMSAANKAIAIFDDLLTLYPEITHPVLGTDNDKIKFYDSNLLFLDMEIKRNKLSYQKFCGVLLT